MLLIRGAFEPDLVKKWVLEKLVETAVDMIEVIPNFWDSLAEIFCHSFSSAALPLNVIKDSANLLPSDKMVGDFLSAVLNKMAESGKIKTHKAWRDSGLKWTDMLNGSGNLEAFLEANNLRWLGNTGAGGLQSGQGQAAGVTKDLLDLEEPDVFAGDLLDLEAPALADNLVILDDSDEESEDETSDDDEDNDGTDGEEEIEACLIEL